MHFIFRRNMILSQNISQLCSIVDKNHELGKVLRCSAFSSPFWDNYNTHTTICQDPIKYSMFRQLLLLWILGLRGVIFAYSVWYVKLWRYVWFYRDWRILCDFADNCFRNVLYRRKSRSGSLCTGAHGYDARNYKLVYGSGLLPAGNLWNRFGGIQFPQCGESIFPL